MMQTCTKRIRPAAVAALLLAVGCGGPSRSGAKEGEEVAEAHQFLEATGESLFRQETFGGNGRTCETCHSRTTGTINPAQLRALYQHNPNAPMFQPIDSDDGTTGSSYQRLLEHATVLISIPLPSNTRLLLDPWATQLTLRRGTPSTLDTPALDPVLMQDGRAPSLALQAHDAILGHAQATREPTAQELASIASFEQTLFSSQAMKDYARTGVAPALPEGNTESEKRGRDFFRPEGACGQCHGGPLLNETGPRNILGQPQGSRFSNAFVSEINFLANPVYTLVVQRPPLWLPEVRLSPDPGRFLITGHLEDFNHFKMSSLWNIKNTAPYFHDNSAGTLEDVLTHYTFALAPQGILLTPQDSCDIIAWMKLL
jgi:cytochrome c peroxidase